MLSEDEQRNVMDLLHTLPYGTLMALAQTVVNKQVCCETESGKPKDSHPSSSRGSLTCYNFGTSQWEINLRLQ